MDVNVYQELAREFRVFDDEQGRNPSRDIIYASLGVAGEAGEIADAVQKFMRGDDIDLGTELIFEMGDLLWFLSLLADALQISLSEVMATNINKLARRRRDNKIRGR